MIPTDNNRHARSNAAFAAACDLMPGGVSSPVRAYRAVGGKPIFVSSGRGCTVRDLDGHDYIDYVLSYGPLILGHVPKPVVAALTRTLGNGTTFGMPTELETELARLVVASVPSVERVRFVNSGTEAVMSAVRLARAATKRDRIIKFTGCYHGHSDSLLVAAGSGATTLGSPSSPGVTAAATSDTLLLPYNDLDAVRICLEDQGEQIAAVLIEPIAGNMGLVPPPPESPEGGYLSGLRALCDRFKCLLIFDEVMTGFRVALGGAQQIYGVKPDITCLGKVIGGGLPCAAYGGRADLMAMVSPQGPVYQAGTLSGNPLAMAAGIATLLILRETDAYDRLETLGQRLETGLRHAAESKAGGQVQIARVGSMLGLFFSDRPVTSYELAVGSRVDRFAVFFSRLLDEGVMLPPSQFETWFLSTAHDEAAIDRTITAAEKALQDAMKI
ncbi:MAG: glutamate-1-semialdehyde 2,1-aminomutase [Phycisphaeraceae bacterium]|nr:glutamate-1-semialdehyde 2,1-aminomutase [Phycisphaeraceae bacterium]